MGNLSAAGEMFYVCDTLFALFLLVSANGAGPDLAGEMRSLSFSTRDEPQDLGDWNFSNMFSGCLWAGQVCELRPEGECAAKTLSRSFGFASGKEFWGGEEWSGVLG